MEQKLRKLIKEAMLQKRETGNSNRYQTFKNILEKAQKTAKDNLQDAVTDSMIMDAAKKEIKQLEDLFTYYKEGTEKRVEVEECITYAKELLPKMATAQEMLDYLSTNNIEKNMGICMKTLKLKFGDALENKIASCVAKEYIS